MADPPSPTVEAVHASATVGKRFESWLKRACKNFGKLLELKAVVDHALRRERLEELSGDERNVLLDAVEEYDKLEDSLAKLVKSKAYEDFRGWSWNEDLIKWVGRERVSVGYCGSRERGKQYLLMDIPLESDLPYEKKVADLLELYRVPVYLRVPTQEEAERSLLEFLGWVKEWPRERLVWAVTNLYPLKDETGGFWSVVTKVLALESLKEGWDSIIEGWTRETLDELKRMSQFQVLKTVLMGEYEAERYVEREIIPKLKEEFFVKYGETTQDPAWVRAKFRERAVEVFVERAPTETKIAEAYEQVKLLIPLEKVELTKGGLLTAIRWAFLHPQMDLDAFASGHVFPLGFTTEQAKAIASKILEKVAKKPPVVSPPVVAPPPPPKPVVPEVKKETVEALVDREIRSYVLVHPETEEFLKVHRNEVLAEALRRVPARVKRDFEEARSRGVSYIEDDAFRSASHEALLVVSEFGEKAKVALPPKPAELPTDKIEALRTVVKVKADDLGLEWSDEVWSRFWHEYEARARELWATKGVTYLEEEVENVLKAVAAPITPPAVRRERVRRPPLEVPVEAPAEVFVSPVTIPRVSISKLPFPRAPSTEEQAILWDAFRYEMARLGQDPYRWRDNFMMHVLNRPYPDWATVLKNFNDFVEAIRTEKPFRLLPLVTLPMPWREEEEQRKYDAILHFIATKLYPSMDELLHGLYTYGVEVTEDDIKKAVKKGFAEKNVWFTSVPKEFLESLTGEKI